MVGSDLPLKSNRTDELRAALAEADVRVLLMVLFHLTGDRSWLRAPYQPQRDVRLIADPHAGLSTARRAEICDAVIDALTSSTEPAVAHPGPAVLQEMMSVCLGEPVPADYVPMMLQEMGFEPERVPDLRGADPTLSAVVIGAGVSGIAAAAKLKAAGVQVTVLEKNLAAGGTWLENTYPDCGVDTPNHFYSYSFAPNPGWSRYFSLRDEIYAYLERCVDAFGVRGLIRFGATVERASWDPATCNWRVEYRSDDGRSTTVTARLLVSAVGQLNVPSIPSIDGLETFHGPVFHSARWRHDVDLTGRSVGLIGTGASAMQLAPRVAEVADNLTIFQRSPQWAQPVAEYRSSVPGRSVWLAQNVPFYAAWLRFTMAWRYGDGLHRHLHKDPSWPHAERSLNERNDRHRAELTDYIARELSFDEELIAKSLPTYPPYAKRMLIDTGWFRTLTKSHVKLVTEPVASVKPCAVVTANDVEHPLDVLVLSTGFQARNILGTIAVEGTGAVTLADRWGDDDARAYLGITVPGFPNFFMLYGPNTNLAHGGSIMFQAECQMRYILSLLEQMVDVEASAVSVRQSVHDAYNKAVDLAHENMVWTHPGVSNWYRNSSGRVVSNSPWRLVDYWHMTKAANLDDYEVLMAKPVL